MYAPENWANIVSDNGVSPIRFRQTIIATNVGFFQQDR